jgi:hypothetical protein
MARFEQLNDLKNPWEDEKKQPPPLGGSIVLNNTSYSGADIKVVVNMYDKGKGTEEEIKRLESQIVTDQKGLDAAVVSKDKWLAKGNSYKPGTDEKYRAGMLVQSAVISVSELQQAIESTKNKVARLRKNGEGFSNKVLAEAQTLSISTHRDKVAVRSFGTVYPRGFTRGVREIAGSIIFTVFDEHVLYRLLEAHASDFDAIQFTTALMDQLPPVDIVISFANEYGSVSRMGIYGVEFVNEGQTMSIEDILTENVVNFVARDYDPLRGQGARIIDEVSTEIGQIQPKKASDLLMDEDYLDFKERVDPYSRFRRRRDPFI